MERRHSKYIKPLLRWDLPNLLD